jgi:hypothetical protein
MSESEINQNLFDEIFRKHRKIALVFLRGAKTKEDNFDPFRKTGLVQQNQNPLPVKVLPKTLSPGELRFREMGETEAGALAIILQDKDVELIKNSEKITIQNKSYYVYRDAVGGKFQVFPTQFAKFSKIILSRKDVE